MLYPNLLSMIIFNEKSRSEIYEPPRGKTNNVVSEQVRHRPSCTSTEYGYNLEILDLSTGEIVLPGEIVLRSYCEADLRLCFRICRLLVFL